MLTISQLAPAAPIAPVEPIRPDLPGGAEARRQAGEPSIRPARPAASLASGGALSGLLDLAEAEAPAPKRREG